MIFYTTNPLHLIEVTLFNGQEPQTPATLIITSNGSAKKTL